MGYEIDYRGKNLILERLPNGKFKKPNLAQFTNVSFGCSWLDDCRVPFQSKDEPQSRQTFEGDIRSKTSFQMAKTPEHERIDYEVNSKGRFPANLLVSDDVLNDGKDYPTGDLNGNVSGLGDGNIYGTSKLRESWHKGDSGSFSRYFDLDAWFSERVKLLPPEVRRTFPFLIVPKASSSERNEGCEELEGKIIEIGDPRPSGQSWERRDKRQTKPRQNFHPTVKPVKLMCYLVTLGSREGDVVLDPFAGSGTMPLACEMLGRRWVAVELNSEYCRIAEARLAPYLKQGKLS